MLLRHLYDFAHSKRLLDDPAFVQKPVHWILALDAEGNLLGGGPKSTRTGDGGKSKKFSCPRIKGSTNGGGIATFLVDGHIAVFGPVDDIIDNSVQSGSDKNPQSNKDQRALANNKKKYDHFWQQIESAFQATDNIGLAALLKFHERQKLNPLPSFLRWEEQNNKKSLGKSSLLVISAGGQEEPIGSSNSTFEVNGELLLENEDIRSFWRETYKGDCEKLQDSTNGVCLVSGKTNQAIARIHDIKIRGVPGTSPCGASIVSFDKNAFSSYGLQNSLNAPISDEAATAYCLALNSLLQQQNHSLKSDQVAFCFWTKENESSDTCDFLASMMISADPQEVRKFIKSPATGTQRELTNSDQFFAVTFSGNSGRIVVRDWLQRPLYEAINNFREWFKDLELFQYKKKNQVKKEAKIGVKNGSPLSLYRLARTTIPDTKDSGSANKIRADVSLQLYRAAFGHIAPPITLLNPILKQLHSKLMSGKKYNIIYDESRFALLKLIINRNRKETDMVIKPELTAETDDPAYNCGRLLAIFNDLQRSAHEGKLEGATIVERYFASASASPMTAFSILWRLHIHHLKKLSRIDENGKAASIAIERKIQDICTHFKQSDEMRQKLLSPVFPRILDLQSQGRFALGFYQQKAAEEHSKNQNIAKKKNTDKAEAESSEEHLS